MDPDSKPLYANGFWIWDEVNDCLLFVNADQRSQSAKPHSIDSKLSEGLIREKGLTKEQAKEIWFTKYLRRKINIETDVVILQDVKDIALYTMDPFSLSNDFINFFHTKAVDNVLRSLIVYFQYVIQVFQKVMLKRKEVKHKLRQPNVNTASENIIRDNLADLRAMFGRNYAVLVTGTGDVTNFYHLNRKNSMSLSDKDKRLFEMFFRVARYVVWIAVNRKHFALIDIGMDNLMRSKTFSIIDHSLSECSWNFTPIEKRIFDSPHYKKERKLLQRSQAIQEILADSHDFRMLAIGVTNIQGSDARQNYLNIAYTAPEELLQELRVPVGLLGIPMRYMDRMLKPIEKSSTERRVSIMPPIPEFTIPPYEPEDIGLVEDMPRVPCEYKISLERLRHIIHQRRLWNQYVKLEGNVKELIPGKAVIAPSYVTLHTLMPSKIKTI